MFPENKPNDMLLGRVVNARGSLRNPVTQLHWMVEGIYRAPQCVFSIWLLLQSFTLGFGGNSEDQCCAFSEHGNGPCYRVMIFPVIWHALCEQTEPYPDCKHHLDPSDPICFCCSIYLVIILKASIGLKLISYIYLFIAFQNFNFWINKQLRINLLTFCFFVFCYVSHYTVLH